MNFKFKFSFKFNTRNTCIGILLICLGMSIVHYNDTCLRITYSNYDKQLRYLDHLLAGMLIPLIFHFLFNVKLRFGMLYYFLWTTQWEGSQFLQRGYFQIDQYIFDILGILLSCLLLKLFNKLETNDLELSKKI